MLFQRASKIEEEHHDILNKFPFRVALIIKYNESHTNFYNYFWRVYIENSTIQRIYIFLHASFMHDLHEQQTDYFINSTLRLNDKTTFIVL